MASNKEELQAANQLLEEFNKHLIAIGNNAEIAFSKIGEPKTVKEINATEKAIEELNASTKELGKTVEKQNKVIKDQKKETTELTKEDKKLIEQQKKLSKLNTETAKTGAILTEAIRKENATLRINAKRRTEAQGSLNQLRAQLIAVRIRYDNLNKSERDNEKIGGRLVKLNNSLDKEVRKLEKSTGRTSRNVGNYSEGIKKAAKESGFFTKQISILNQVQATFTALTSKSSVETSTNTVAKQTNKIATQGMTRAQKLSNLATAIGTKGLKAFKVALASTGIGAIVLLLGGLITFMTQSQKGIDGVSSSAAGMGAVFTVLKDRLIDFGEGVFLIFSSIPNALKKLVLEAKLQGLEIKESLSFGDTQKEAQKDIAAVKDELNNLANKGGFSEGIDKIKNSFKGIGDEMKREKSEAIALEISLQAVRDREIELIGVNAQLRKSIDAARLAAKDENSTNAEKLVQLDLAIEKENELLDNQLEIAKERARIAREQVELAGSSTTAEELKEVAELEAAAIDLETSNLKRRRTIASERLTLILKVRQEQEQRELNDRKREIELIDDAEEKALAKELLRFETELKAAKKNRENLQLVEAVHLKKMKEISDKFESDRLKKQNDQGEKDAERNNEIAKREEDAANELSALKDEIAIKEAQSIDDRESKEIEAAKNRTGILLNEEELLASERILIEEQLQDEISDIKKKADEDRLAEQKKADELAAKQQKELTDAALTILEKGIKNRSDARLKELDKELSDSESQRSKLEDLAAKGDENAVKSLKAAQEQEAAIRREQAKEVAAQKRNELILAGIKAYTANGDVPKTLADVATLIAGLNDLPIPGFWDGADTVGDTLGLPQLSGKDGHIVRVDGKEQVHSVKDRKEMANPNTGKFRTRDELKNIVNLHDKGISLDSNLLNNYSIGQRPYESNAELIKRVDSMGSQIEKAINNLPRNMPTQEATFNEFMKAFRWSQKQGNQTKVTNYLFD